MKRYIREHRTLLGWSTALLVLALALIGLAAHIDGPLREAHEWRGPYHSPLSVVLLTAAGELGLQLVFFGNLFLAAFAVLKRAQLGFTRLAIILLPSILAGCFYRSFEPDFSWHWRGFADTQQSIEWIVSGLYWSLTVTAAVAVAYVVAVMLATWVADGFRQTGRS